MKSHIVSQRFQLLEHVQRLALLGLYRVGFFSQAAFYGGTALRLLYGIPRFSEDLDFTLLRPDPQFRFDAALKGLQEELRADGLEASLEIKNKSFVSPVQSAFIKTNTLHLMLRVQGADIPRPKGMHPEALIRVKIEVDTDPPGIYRSIPMLLRGSVLTEVETLPLPLLFAGKTHAALCRAWVNRVKGRDWYDMLWFLNRGVGIDIAACEAKLRQSGFLKQEHPLTLPDLQSLLRQRIGEVNWQSAQADLEPFLEDRREVEWLRTETLLSAVDLLTAADGTGR